VFGPCRSVFYHLNFLRIFSHRCVPIRLRHFHLRFLFSALRLPWIPSANDAAACALIPPSTSSAASTRLRYLWSPLLRCAALRFDPSTFFRNQPVRTLLLGLRPLWLRSLTSDVSSTVSQVLSLAGFKFFRFRSLPHRVVTLRSGLSWLRFYHSPFTF
jgi:hypothetical protein